TERPVVDRRYPTPRAMFDSRSYPKGAWVLHMLRSRLGDDEFFRGLRRYGVVFAYQTAETSDFRKVFEELYGVSLERFFYDWTERKGHPQLTVKSDYDPEGQVMRINIQQTQQEEPFEFVLEVELTDAGAAGNPIVNRQRISGKEQTLLVPVQQRPKLIRVDPNLTLLAEIKEEKAFDWWKEQLSAPSVAERIRAIEHFSDSKEPDHQELLAKVLKEDPFYGVRVEAARALGKTVNEVSENALIAGLSQHDPKVRRACAQALAKFKKSDRVEKALLTKEKEGDASYFVTADLLRSLTTVCENPDIDRLLSALEKESHRDVIRTAALQSLGKCKAPQAFETLVEWTNHGHNRDCRRAAIGALGELLSKNDLSSEQKEVALATLESLLADSGPRVRSSAVAALGRVPDLPPQQKTRIEELAEQDANESVRLAADRLLKKIDSNSSDSKELQKLRTELDQLKQQNSELQERLERIEKR
ncbi:MAG: HEAT repeat domain-containing protein, partial [Planctomycetes bacterium]|nr:HEAT repeat domain-containing protein [Planctomycetota bacterium]